MGKSVRNTDGGLPGLDTAKPIEDNGDQLPGLKKKDAGSLSPSDSSQKPGTTAPPVGTSGSDPKQVTANFKNNSLTPTDVEQPSGMTLGPSPEQISHAINNKGKNIDRAQNASTDNYISSLVKMHQEVQGKISQMDSRMGYRDAVASGNQEGFESDLKNLKNQETRLRTEIQKNYDAKKEKLVPELTDNLRSMLGGKNWEDIYSQSTVPEKDQFGFDVKKHLQWNPETHSLTPESVQWIAGRVDGIMNKKKDAAVNAQVSGDLDNKPRTYEDLTKSVVDNLNLVPVRKAQQDFAEDYTKKNPGMKDALAVNKGIHDYFSASNFDDLKTKVKIQADRDLISAQDRYYGPNGLFQKNEDYVGIQHKFAELVGSGKMSDAVAKKQMEAEITQNPALKKIKDNLETEKRKIVENTQKQYENYLIDGLKAKHPEYTTYKDGSIGLASMSEDKYTKMMEGYREGLDAVAKKMGAESNEAYKKQANDKAKAIGPFLGGLGMSMNEIEGGLTKMIFNKTGWGGEKTRHFEAQEIASPQISQSDVAATWNMKGWESIKNPDFYLSGVGKMVPVIAGAAAATTLTEGAGAPEYISWLASAGLFTAQSSLSAYDQLLNTKDVNGNMLTESDAAHFAAKQAAEDFLPNVLMMAVGSGTLLRAKNIIKPTIGAALKKGAVGILAQQPFFAWQGYNDYADMLEAQGKKADMYDYLQSKEFRDNLVSGMVLGGALSAIHTPGQFMKSMDNWTKMVHTSEGEFKNLIPQNYALGQEMNGQGNYLRDALKMHVFNVDPEGLNEEGKRQLADLRNTLLYSVNLDKNIRTGNLDPKNIKDLYQAHNLSLADQHDYLSDQAAKEGNKSLSDIYKDKAKDYREQAKASANGEAKYHYLVNDEGHPIFMSDKSFKTLEQEGTIAKWIKEGTIKDVHNSDDPEFAQRYKDFVTVKDEATMQGADVTDHGKDLIEANKEKLGVYYGVAKENPDMFYKEVADQVFGRNADGSVSLRPDAEVEARTQYGDDIVDMAMVLHPAKEEAPVAEEKKETPVVEKVKETEEKKTEEKTETITPEDNITVGEMLDKKGTYKGQKGTFVQDGQSVVFKVDGGKREYELGNVKEVSGMSVKDFGIEQDQSVVSANEAGNITVRGKEYLNKYSDPLQAINYDKEGNVVSVNLDTADGQKRTFRGPVAEDIAYQIHLKQISDNHEQPALEDFINSDEPTRKEMEDAGLAASAEVPATDNPEAVQRTPIEPKPVKEKAAKKTEPKKESASEVKEPPPTKPSTPEVREPAETPKEEFTGVRREKLKAIKGAKALFERQKVVKWTETYGNALSNVQAMYPNKGLYEAMRSRVNEFVAKVDSGVLFNPTSEDIAVFNVFKNETMQRMSEIPGWDSNDNLQRISALAEFTALNADLYNVARVTNPGGEAGRAFNLLQSEIAQDPDAGLKIRRMELLGAKGGGKLSQADLDFTAENWQKEQALSKQEQDLKMKGMQEKFDKQMASLKADYEKKLKDARAEKKPATEKEKREKLLKEKGADLAAKIRSGKLKGTYATFPGVPQAINIVLEGIAKLVEGGYSLAQAIDEYVQANKVKNKDEFTDNLFTIFNKQERQEESYADIKKLAEASGASDVTSDMVGKNLIRDYVNSHVGLHDPKEVLDIAHAELQKVLPDLEKSRLTEAYLKEGDFKQPTKKELETGFKQSQKNFERLTKLEKDINDLTEKGELHKRNSSKPSPYDKDIEAKEDEKKAIMNEMGIKTSGEDKYTKASYDQRAKAHNDRIDAIGSGIDDKISSGKLSDKSQKALVKLKNQLDAAKIKLDPTSALSQDKTLEGGLHLFKAIKSEFQRAANEDMAGLGGINRELQKALDKFGTDKDDSDQQIKLQRAKDKAKKDADQYLKKISNGEYEDKKPTTLTQTDADLIKLQRNKDAIQQLYRKNRTDYENANKGIGKKVAEFARAAMVDYLISGALIKVAGSALLRPAFEATTKLTFGKGFEALPFETTKAISERAKAGGEGSSVKAIKKGYEAYLRQYSPEQLKALYDKANDKYEASSKAYIAAEAEEKRAKYDTGKDSPEYKKAVDELQKAKNKRDNDLIDAVGNSVYNFIAGSSIKEGLEVLMHRSTQMERQFGDFDSEAWEKFKASDNGKAKFATALDNASYVLNFIGRSHATLKNFSARFSFANGFISRLEYEAGQGKDISSPDRLLEIAHESYHDWERGKYQEANWWTDTWNKVTNSVEKISPEMAYLMRADVAITRVPVNMLREGVMEYTLGAFRGSIMAAREYYKAKGIVLQDGFTPESESQFRSELKEQLNKMDADKAATIVRAFRKGGLGLGLYALALMGHAAFGGWAHKGQTAEDKKKAERELDTGIPELKTGEIQIGKWVMPEWSAKVVEHTPAFAPLGFGLGLAKVYDNNIKDGKSTPEAAYNSAKAQIDHLANSLPMIDKVVAPLAAGAYDNIKPKGQWDDVDQNGNPMKRHAFHMSDYFKYLHFGNVFGKDLHVGSKDNILTEEYYKQAVSTQKSYRQQITEVEINTSLSKKDKEEQRSELLKQLDADIEEIYRQNKENPQ